MTSWVYRLLGLLAPINQRASQLRTNFIPANVLLMLALGAIVFLNVNRISTVMKARTPPNSQPVRELLVNVRFAGSYVAPEGRLATDARIAFDQQSAGGNLTLTDYTWVPLVDRRSGEALLVQFDANESFDQAGEDIAIPGILRPMMPAVARRLAATNYVHAGTRIDRRFMLIAGRLPGSLTTPSVVIVVALVLLLAFVWLTLNRNVVFMRSDDTPAPGAVAQRAAPESLFASGTLTFDGRTHRFFTNVAGTITRASSGNIVFVSMIETSSTRWGLKRIEHSGLWLLSIQAGSISDVQAGDVLWGRQKRRAVRFRFVNSVTGKEDRAVIASATADPLAALYA